MPILFSSKKKLLISEEFGGLGLLKELREVYPKAGFRDLSEVSGEFGAKLLKIFQDPAGIDHSVEVVGPDGVFDQFTRWEFFTYEGKLIAYLGLDEERLLKTWKSCYGSPKRWRLEAGKRDPDISILPFKKDFLWQLSDLYHHKAKVRR